MSQLIAKIELVITPSSGAVYTDVVREVVALACTEGRDASFMFNGVRRVISLDDIFDAVYEDNP